MRIKYKFSLLLIFCIIIFMGSVSAESNLTDNCSDLNNYNIINEVNVNNNQILSEYSNNVENNDFNVIIKFKK